MSQVPQVYAAISDVMGKLAKIGIGKDQENKQQGYRFRGIDDCYNALAPLLSECRLLILPRVLSRIVTERETRNGGVLFHVVLDVEFDFVSAVDGSKHTVRISGEAMDSGDKATNKAMSAAYKYACIEGFCIPTQGDNDADSTTHEVANGISEDQIDELMALAEKMKADRIKFLEFMGVERLAQIQPSKFDIAKKALETGNYGKDFHSPKGGLGKSQDLSKVGSYCTRFIAAMDLDKEEIDIADAVYKIHEEIMTDAELYVAVGNNLTAKARASLKKYIALHKAVTGRAAN